MSPKESPADWTQAFIECDEINALVFQNRLNEAFERTTAQ